MTALAALTLAIIGCSRAPAPVVLPGTGPGPVSNAAVRLAPAPGSRVEARDLPGADALADLIARTLAPAGLRLRAVSVEAAPFLSPFGGGGGGGGATLLAIRGQIEAETAEALFRAESASEEEMRVRGLLPRDANAPRFVAFEREHFTRVGEVRYDPQREDGPLYRTVFVRPSPRPASAWPCSLSCWPSGSAPAATSSATWRCARTALLPTLPPTPRGRTHHCA